MTLKSGTGQACAACKYQRRRCTPECLLAPFFPADQPKMFQNVHRLFGVKNIQNLLKELDPDQKAMAMKSIKFHAAMRDKYPVYGCLVEIQQLSYQIQMVEEELQAVLQQLAYYRQQQQQQEMSPTNDYLSELQLGMAPPRNTALSLVHEDNPPQYNGVVPTLPIAPQLSYSNSPNADHYSYLDFKENNVVNSLCQQPYDSNSNDNNTNSLVMHSQQLVIPQPLPHVQQETTQDYNEMHPFFDHIDDTQSYIGPKEAYESSLESSMKDSRQLVEQMDENELKSAAACFSLTSVN
ncbi:LOB domain-containing protein 27-like [Sesamum indicum]|uniref:LOB domain-containing protein 27-like n=1 Tax=Sesamum indicum TaxID=4182 RepID=A0A6I9TNJ5_SESIN|nr:LOB domain-containing protein 27-like [Sesamum indicum]